MAKICPIISFWSYSEFLRWYSDFVTDITQSNMILKANSLTIGYRRRRNDTVIARDLDLSLHAGELVCLLGPNGAGKSTLMRTLAGMQPPLAGQVRLDGDDVGALSPQVLAKKLSVVLTERVEVGLLTAYALIALGRYPHTNWRGTLSAEDETIVQDAIKAIGIENLAARPVSQLSDGERQKVMIARALAQQPKLMLLDEPTAFLDLPRRVEIMQILRTLAYSRQRAILLSTHDLDLALRSADTLWLMSDGQLHVGAPEDLVLNGVFAKAFASTGVSFDINSGAFELAQTSCGSIDLIGDGVRAQWTARALQRIGFDVHFGRNNAAYAVICLPQTWTLQSPHGNGSFDSLAPLLRTLRNSETAPFSQ